jgi:hypothetical protein
LGVDGGLAYCDDALRFFEMAGGEGARMPN